MARQTSPNRLFSAFLVLSFVHQLGACACGCLDHNAWYQTALALVGDDHDHGHRHAPPEQPVGSDAEHAHCDGCVDLVYVSGRHAAAKPLESSVLAVVWDSPHATSDAVARTSASLLKTQAALSLAPDVRAFSQVLLI